MTFTDEDLKRIKEQIPHYPDEIDVDIRIHELKALLNRLEAAEKALEIYIQQEGTSFNNALEIKEWKKAAGK